MPEGATGGLPFASYAVGTLTAAVATDRPLREGRVEARARDGRQVVEEEGPIRRVRVCGAFGKHVPSPGRGHPVQLGDKGVSSLSSPFHSCKATRPPSGSST